jgi:hypothetical protein
MEFDPPTPFLVGGDPKGLTAQMRAQLSPTPIRLVEFYAPPSAQ